MKTGKLITFNIIAYLTAINILYLYFGHGANKFVINKAYLLGILTPFLVVTLIFLSTFLLNYSYIATYAKSKKNLLRISLLILSIITIISIITRIMEFIKGIFITSAIINTILYILLVILNIMILKELHLLLRRLFSKEFRKENF